MVKAVLLTFMAGAVASAADISGNWAVKGDVSGYAIELSCALSQKGADLSGTCKGGGRPDRNVTGHVDGKNVEFAYDVDYDGNQMHAVYKGTLDSDTSMKGDVDVMGNAGTFSASKEK